MNEAEPRKKKIISPPAAGWELTFCALSLILVAFFAMLVSYSSIEDEKVTNFMRGFAGDLSQRSIQRTISSDATGFMPTPDQTIRLPSKEIIALETQAFLLSARRLDRVAKVLALEAGEVSIEKTERGFKAVLKGDVLFASGTADIAPELYPYMDELISILAESDYFVRIEGHTDTVPIATARYPSNWELSTDRAVSFIRYFQERGGIDARRLEAVGFGEFRPVAANDTAEGRAKNRRVECYFDMTSA